jgi:hypothetical protein
VRWAAQDGSSALRLAVTHHQPEVVEWLIHEQDVDVEDVEADLNRLTNPEASGALCEARELFETACCCCCNLLQYLAMDAPLEWMFCARSASLITAVSDAVASAASVSAA